MDYDVLILGGGIVGCSIAYELSKYSLNISLIEKEYDIGNDAPIPSSLVVFNGMETLDDLDFNMKYEGVKIIEKASKKFNIPFKRLSFIEVEEDDKESNIDAYNENHLQGIEDNIINNLKENINIKPGEIRELENLGIVRPYDLTIAYGEIAFDNGVKFRLGEKVIDIKKISKGFKVTTTKNKFTCKMLINTVPSDDELNYKVKASKKTNHKNKSLKCFLLDKKFKIKLNKAVDILDCYGDRVILFKNNLGETIAYVLTEKEISYEAAFEKLKRIFKGIKEEYINREYSNDIFYDKVYIDDALVEKGYIKVQGKNYGVATMAPFISNKVCDIVTENISCKLKSDFYDKRREIYKFRDMDNEGRKKLIEMNPKYGRMICMCRMVTEGEIIDAIRRPLGARTVEGIRRRTGALLGECDGSYCLNKVVSILADETNKDMTEILDKSIGSNILKERIKQFDTI